jgi:hypothetical protein
MEPKHLMVNKNRNVNQTKDQTKTIEQKAGQETEKKNMNLLRKTLLDPFPCLEDTQAAQSR